MSIVIETIPTRENNVSHNNNVIDKEAQAWLKPLNLIDTLFICSKYKIRDNVISSNSLLYNAVSAISGLVIAFIYFFCIFKASFYITWEGLVYAKYVDYSLMYATYFIGVILTYSVNIKHKNSNVVFALKIQRVCEIFKVHGKSLRSLIIFNWIYIIALSSYHMFWVFFFHYAYSSYGFPIEELVPNCFNIQFDVTALYASRVMRLTWQTLRSWAEGVRNLEIPEDENNEYYWNKNINVYNEILDAYDIIGKSFHLLIFHYVFHLSSNALISIGLRIEIGKATGGRGLFVLVAFISLLWLVKSMLILTSLSIESERFHTELKEVRSTCIQLIGSKTCSDIQKRICKNILRIQETSFRKFNACGVFNIDGVLPIQLCGLITTYLVVMLQFEFL